MKVIKKNLKDFPVASDPGSLRSLKSSDELIKLRDSFVIFDSKETKNRYDIGYAIIYPGGKTGGHSHEEAEEIYHIIDGRGKMILGDEEFDIESGDTFIVPSKVMHSTLNTGSTPIKFFWAVINFSK